jgi:chromosome segregation ATPase
VKADEVKDYLSRLEYSLSAKYNAETDKAKGIIESLSNIQQSKDNAIKEVNDTIKELKSNQEIDFAENERECNERMDKALNDKFDSIANKSKINEFSKQVEKLDNSLIELQNTKKELSNIKNEMNYLDETHQKVIGFIEYILKDIKLTKKKQEEYEERLAMLKKKLASGIRGEEWKQVKKEYDEMKDFKYSD